MKALHSEKDKRLSGFPAYLSKAGSYHSQNVVFGVAITSFWSLGKKKQDKWFTCAPGTCQPPVMIDLSLDFKVFKSSFYSPLI